MQQRELPEPDDDLRLACSRRECHELGQCRQPRPFLYLVQTASFFGLPATPPKYSRRVPPFFPPYRNLLAAQRGKETGLGPRRGASRQSKPEAVCDTPANDRDGH